MQQNNDDIVIVNADTDSITIAKADGGFWTDDEQEAFLEALNSEYPELISFEHDGYYDAMVVFKSKNYAMKLNKKYTKPKDLNPDGTVKTKTKGSSIRDQKKELALREMMNLMIDVMLNGDVATLPLIYKKYVQEAMNVQDIMRWSTKKTISDKILAGRDPKADVRKQELDVWKAIKNEDDTQQGNKIFLYPVILGEEITPGGISAKTGKPLKDKVKTITGLRLAKEWDNDHNVEHLIKRVYATVKIFKNVLDMEQFIDYSKKKNTPLLEDLKNEVIDLKLNTTNIEMDEDDDEGTDEDQE